MEIVLLILLAAYFTPAIIALLRKHRQSLSICLLNIFLGWTVVGWVCALVWAASSPPAPVVIYRDREA